MCICINMYLNIYIYIYIFIYMCSSEWTSRCRPCRPTRWCTRHAPPHPQNALFVSRALGFALSLAHRYPPPPARHPPPARLTATCRPCLLIHIYLYTHISVSIYIYTYIYGYIYIYIYEQFGMDRHVPSLPPDAMVHPSCESERHCTASRCPARGEIRIS